MAIVIKLSIGPFAKCFDLKDIDQEDMFEGCRVDVCMTKEADGDIEHIRCKAIDAFVKMCKTENEEEKSEAIDLGVWRSTDFCRMYRIKIYIHIHNEVSECRFLRAGVFFLSIWS